MWSKKDLSSKWKMLVYGAGAAFVCLEPTQFGQSWSQSQLRDLRLPELEPPKKWRLRNTGFKLWWNYFIIPFSYTILYDCTLLRHLVQIFWSHTILLKTLWFFTKKFSEFDPMISFKFLKWVCQLSQLSGGKNRINYLQYSPFYQCCRAGASGAKIIWGPGAGAENKFK